MIGLKDVPMKPKLIALFLLVGLIPLALVGWWATDKAADALMQKSYDQLRSIRDIKADSIQHFFKTIDDQIVTFSEDKMIVQAMADFKQAFPAYRNEQPLEEADIAKMRKELGQYYTGDFTNEYKSQNDGKDPGASSFLSQLDADSVALQYQYIKKNENPLGSKHLLDDPGDGSAYAALHAELHPIIRNYLDKFGYYDIFLVDPDTGDIVYSVFKELDYSTSLIDGPYSKTNFGEAFREARDANEKDAVFLVDYKPYTPSYEAPASFIASPIFDHGERIGVAIFQMPLDRVNQVMSNREGLGKTGESYLVGPDKLMRSDSYLDPDHHSVRASFSDPAKGSVDTDGVKAALAGKTHMDVIIDYNGNPVLSAYRPFNLGPFTWALLTEIDEAEVLEPVVALKHAVLISGGIMAGLIVVVALLIALSITSPLKKALAFSRAIADGDLEQDLPVRQRDEIGALAHAMRRIPETLLETMAEIKDTSQTISLGNLRTQADASKFNGAYADMVGNINTLSANFVGFMDSIPIPLMAIDNDFKIQFMNEAGAEIGGTTPDHLHGKRCSEHFKTSDCNTPNCACDQALRTSDKAMSETDAHPGDLDLDINYIATPIKDENGAVVGAFEIVVDQTEIKAAQRKILSIANDAGGISQRLSSSTEQISAQVEQSSRGAEEQRQLATETATAMEEMNATVLEVAQNASAAAEMAENSRAIAREGSNTMGEMKASTMQVQDLTEGLKQSMAQLGERTEDIGNIMNVINDIADQTNLLALNAAIEAARAGEAGRGFAVVADEVRKLAEKTMGATNEVGEAIKAIQDGARTNVEETDRAAEVVMKSTELAEDASSGLEKILNMAEETADQVRAIATAAEEQSAASEEVTHSTETINRISAETSEAMTQSSQSLVELTDLATQMDNLIREMQK